MRKILSLSILAALVCGLAASCGSDEEENYSFIENATFDTSFLLGRWDVEYMEEPNYSSYWYGLEDIRMTFGKDGTFTAKYSTSEYEYIETTTKYTVKGDVITLDLDPTVTITPVSMDEYDVYFWMSYRDDNGNGHSVHCKGKKR